MRFVVLALVLAGCPAVNVEQVDVHADNPEVNVGDVGSHNSVDVNVDATEQPADEQPEPVEPEKPVVAQQIKRVAPSPEPEPTEPEPLPEPCADDDSDGVCNDADMCPAGSDADEDGTGYADGCEDVLWTTTVGIGAPNTVPANYEPGQPAVVVIQPLYQALCRNPGELSGFVAVQVPQLWTGEPIVVRLPRPESGRGAKMVECLEAGVTSTAVAGLSEFDSYSSLFTPTADVPGAAGKHIAYFEVVLNQYVTVAGMPGTMVTAFHATISARGY